MEREEGGKTSTNQNSALLRFLSSGKILKVSVFIHHNILTVEYSCHASCKSSLLIMGKIIQEKDHDFGNKKTNGY